MANLNYDFEDEQQLLRKLIRQGFGRRRIADALGTTEYRARTLIRMILGEVKEVSRSKKKAEKPKRKIARQSKVIVRETKAQSKTKIQTMSIGVESDLVSNIETRKPNLKVIVLSDIHIPYQDQNALNLALAYMDDYQPDVIVLNGDIADFYGVSSYSKTKKDALNYQEELDEVSRWLIDLVDRFSDSDIYYVEGNHETRASRTMGNRAPEFLPLRDLKVNKLLGLEGLGIKWIPESQELKIGGLMFIHGHKARRHAGTTARAHFEDYGCSVIVGHVHRLSVAYKRNKYGNHAMIENGTLCDLDVEYMKYPDWQHGFTELNFDGEDFSVVQHPIIDYKLITVKKTYVV